jgi:hypothetical protein
MIYTSYSLYSNYNIIKNQLTNICKLDNDTSFNNFEEITKIVNHSEYIFLMSKIKPQTNCFYDFLEIVNILNIYENYKNKEHNFLYISPNFIDIIKHKELVREKYKNDITYGFDKIDVRNYLFIDTIPGNIINPIGLFNRYFVFNDFGLKKIEQVV